MLLTATNSALFSLLLFAYYFLFGKLLLILHWGPEAFFTSLRHLITAFNLCLQIGLPAVAQVNCHRIVGSSITKKSPKNY